MACPHKSMHSDAECIWLLKGSSSHLRCYSEEFTFVFLVAVVFYDFRNCEDLVNGETGGKSMTKHGFNMLLWGFLFFFSPLEMELAC